MHSWIEKQFQDSKSPDTVLHLGAGLCSEIHAFLALEPRQIFLVEPSPEVLAELVAGVAGFSNVQVIPLAATAVPGPVHLNLFNDYRHNSIHEGAQPSLLLPGLRANGQVGVAGLPIPELVEQLGIHADDNNLLLIDTYDQQADMLRALIESGRLDWFSRIVIRGGPGTTDSLIKELQARDYARQGSVDRSDPDWPRFHFVRDTLAIENRDLGAKLKALEQQAGELDGDLKTALQLQALREADLQDLQDRYQRVLERAQAQADLLGGLQNRLATIKKYLQQAGRKGRGPRQETIAARLVKTLFDEELLKD